MQIQTTNNLTVNGVKCLVYGRTGSQKTRQAALTAPRPIIINTDKGLLSLKDSAIPFIDVNGHDEYQAAFNLIGSAENINKWDTLILDDISQLSRTIILDYLKGKSNSGKKMHGEQAYGMMQIDIENIITNLLAIEGKNVIVIAKEKEFLNMETGQPMVKAKFEGKQLDTYIPFKFNFYGYCFTVPKEGSKFPLPQIRMMQDPRHDAKDRTGKLDEIEYGDYNHIFTKIMNT